MKKGERLTLHVTSDRDDTLHVHGYDRELPLSAGTSATLTLTADRTGLFEVETHGSGLVRPFPPARAVAGQLPLFLLMIAYTLGGIGLLVA
ncbi:hypothetical protein ACIGW0_21525 [Streptomyces bikiniensis]|uniref:Uncharacterized protein n=1 Tax=Streptomyces bikiniensis TaxID=1896 RepID=A0ABW8CYP0_STRBI